jgi:hypothetical protein
MEVQVARDRELGLENQGIGARGGVPTACPDMPAEVLWPRKTRADRAARRRAGAQGYSGVCGELHDVCGAPRRLCEHRGTDRRVTADQWT